MDKFRQIRVVDFFDALNSGDFSLVAETEELFLDILEDYQEVMNDKKSPTDKVVKKIMVMLELMENAKNLLLLVGWDEAQVKILKDLSLEIRKEHLIEDLKRVDNKILKLRKRLELLDRSSAKQEGKQEEENNSQSTYFILSSLSIALGFDLDYDTINLDKFIYLNKALTSKNDAERKAIEDSKTNK